MWFTLLDIEGGRSRGRQSATPTPPPRASAPIEDASDLSGGVGDFDSRSPIDSGSRPPIG
ncbi:hypothetical protein CRG98_033239 [Punica granatum]|uniref:Uncharacterized protein n=1 Tax=Punica granatum TaxID=22663 RepID=A0A2I0IQR4_PUNGR|nr:hypothetical protein CRG98_033239 [Punica granatum]